ncbi:MAG: sel1 repeat family protein [Magnetovibrio sp.]|nr:sel1 repeat family protein [Magnetovibrio sp.]
MYVHLGIVILGFPCPSNVRHSTMSSQQGVDKVVEALDLLAARSPRSMAVIDMLKKAGPVVIVYDPAYPPRSHKIASIQNALFLPTFIEKFDEKSSGKKFTMLIGRDGIRQTLNKLAAVLVHELMGHGKQYLEDRILTMRVLDVECEAWLYEEQAYQDLKVDKLSSDLVMFRKNLEEIHCSDYIRYMRKRVPEQVALWDQKDLNVPRLLETFKGYIQAQRDRGMISNAQDAVAKQRKDTIAQIERHGRPEDLFKIGKMYMAAVGQTPDPASAAVWFEKAAKKGHGGAMLALAQLYENGEGVAKDLKLALKLYVKAAKKGNFKAFYELGVMFESGLGVPKNQNKAQVLFAKALPGMKPGPLLTFGIMYHDGTGFPKNDHKASEFFLKAARLGNKVAQYEIGLLLEQGLGLPKNVKMASVWIHKSARQGYAPAKPKLAN